MEKRNDLRGFLRREVIKHQIRLPGPPRTRKIESHKASDLFPSDETSTNVETDSLFGEPILSKEDIRKERLQNFLSQPPKANSPPHHSLAASANPALQGLKEELKELVCYGEGASHREKDLIRRQKNALIEEIAIMEDMEKLGKVKGDKAKLKERLKTLPEPISRLEKQQLRANWAKPEKSRREQEKLRKRARQEASEELEDLDGEDRLRLGVTKKRRATSLSGRWNSTVHDYFPGLEKDIKFGEGKGPMTLRDLDPADRKLFRRELTELGKELAREEGKEKRSAAALLERDL